MNIKLLALSSAILLSLTACTSATGTAATWSDGACSQENPGVTLSVDYLGNVTTRCAKNFTGNGWLLFSAAGFKVRGTAKYPTAFACQIDGKPDTAKCDDTDASGAYWGYYIPFNGNWEYAVTGASDHKSKCGTWEGWVYMENELTQSSLPTPTEFTCN